MSRYAGEDDDDFDSLGWTERACEDCGCCSIDPDSGHDAEKPGCPCWSGENVRFA